MLRQAERYVGNTRTAAALVVWVPPVPNTYLCVCHLAAAAAAVAASTPVFMLILIFGGSGASATVAGSVAGLALVAFAASKLVQPITDDVGDKSVFRYLREQQGLEDELR